MIQHALSSEVLYRLYVPLPLSVSGYFQSSLNDEDADASNAADDHMSWEEIDSIAYLEVSEKIEEHAHDNRADTEGDEDSRHAFDTRACMMQK